jgi:hypothetical protein
MEDRVASLLDRTVNLLTTKVTEEDAAAFQAAAEKEGMTMSEYLRAAARSAARNSSSSTRVRGSKEVAIVKAATAVVVMVLTLLAWVPVEAHPSIIDNDDVPYEFSTPSPDGKLTCSFTVSGTKPLGGRVELTVGVHASIGEAYIPQLAVGDGIQPGCDIYPETTPTFSSMLLDPTQIGIAFNGTLQLHAHPGSDCTVGGTAAGTVFALTIGKGVEDLLVTFGACQ